MREIEISRSEEVQDLLEEVPHWLIIKGNLLILIIVIIFICLSWLIRYPDIIESSAILTTDIPPQKEYAKTGGKFEDILVNNNQEVIPGQPLAIIENSANYRDVFMLKSFLDTIALDKEVFDYPLDKLSNLILGDIESQFGIFETNYVQYSLNRELMPIANERVASEFTIKELKFRLNNALSQQFIYEREVEFKEKDLKRYTILRNKGVISDQEYEMKLIDHSQTERNYKSLVATVSQIKENIKLSEKNSKGYQIDQTMNEIVLLQTLIQSLIQLKNQISEWENKYVLQSHIEGKVSLLNYWNKNQTVNQGDLVFTIIPKKFTSYMAKLKVPTHNSGKIKKNQVVHMSLENFPETEYGILKGKVQSITNLSDKNGYYFVDVSVPNDLRTSYNKKIEFKQEMMASANIITEDLRLLERIFIRFKNVLRN